MTPIKNSSRLIHTLLIMMGMAIFSGVVGADDGSPLKRLNFSQRESSVGGVLEVNEDHSQLYRQYISLNGKRLPLTSLDVGFVYRTTIGGNDVFIVSESSAAENATVYSFLTVTPQSEAAFSSVKTSINKLNITGDTNSITILSSDPVAGRKYHDFKTVYRADGITRTDLTPEAVVKPAPRPLDPNSTLAIMRSSEWECNNNENFTFTEDNHFRHVQIDYPQSLKIPHIALDENGTYDFLSTGNQGLLHTPAGTALISVNVKDKDHITVNAGRHSFECQSRTSVRAAQVKDDEQEQAAVAAEEAQHPHKKQMVYMGGVICANDYALGDLRNGEPLPSGCYITQAHLPVTVTFRMKSGNLQIHNTNGNGYVRPQDLGDY